MEQQGAGYGYFNRRGHGRKLACIPNENKLAKLHVHHGAGNFAGISPSQLAIHDSLARPAEAVRALVEVIEAVELGVGGHDAGDALVVAVVVEDAIVANLVDRDGGGALDQQRRRSPAAGGFSGHPRDELPLADDFRLVGEAQWQASLVAEVVVEGFRIILAGHGGGVAG